MLLYMHIVFMIMLNIMSFFLTQIIFNATHIVLFMLSVTLYETL